jgi:hypothetical protein
MHPYLFKGLEAGPQTISRLIRWIPADRMDVPSHPGRFTPREVIAHLADWEPISRGRMQTAFERPGAEVPDLDEGQIAIEKRYSEWDPLETAEEFVRRRSETLAWLSSLQKSDWRKTAIHTARGEMSIYDFANLELGHDMYHIAQLCQVLEAR